ncbi:MAG TPA: hypothetical protein DD714_06960 [Candidatus Omnitrophica bacterium]|nr:hypothetical protein [Candidatus Omnitrophota bacterium]
MSSPTGPFLKKIAVGLLLIVVLHYALDEPTRSLVIGPLFEYHYPPPPPPDDKADDRPGPPGILNVQALVANASFEQWDAQPDPLPRWWSESLSVSTRGVIKRVTDVVRHGASSVRLECDGLGHCGDLRQALPPEAIPRLRGHRLKFSVWAISNTPQTPCLHLHEDTEHASACLQTPPGTWERLSVERTIGPEATRVLLIIEIPRAREPASPVVYVDDGWLVQDPPSSEAPGTPPATAPPLSP